MKFKRQALEAAGFQGFLTVRDLSEGGLDNVPESAGVYVVLREIDAPPEFLKENPGGHFRGRNPTVGRETLRNNWVNGAHVIYIGKGNNLRTRLRQFIAFGNGKRVAHWGGRFVWQIKNADEFVVAWKVVGEGQDPAHLEQQLLQEFCAVYGSLPFANLIM